ncbi:reduced folate transporter [Synchiropus splendidus]|uniref:reduced folate transporter n=1 Tax=Synchiropus splendidus TaxID=270530 RepID=UPI00237E3657|nr:reduced folate transporter [Synchiropus splendidus]
MVADYSEGNGDLPDGETAVEIKMAACQDDNKQDNGDVEMVASAAEAPCPPEEPPTATTTSFKWEFAVIFLCFYGFMASIRPGESFITPYLLSPERNFTRKQVTNEITPVLTYSYMAVLVPAFLLTDLMRYKPVLIIQGVSQVVIWIILLLGDSLLQMQFMEFFYGITMACRVAYSSYIFSLVSPASYQRVASYSRSSVLLGVFTSSVLGQLCLSLGNISYYTLNAVTLGFASFGLLLALCLPWPKRSLFFNKASNKAHAEATEAELHKMNLAGEAPSKSVNQHVGSCWKDSVIVQMLLELKNVVKKPSLRLWSLWWVFNSTGYYLVLFYVHILWSNVTASANQTIVYNGGVEAASTLLSVLTSFSAGFVKIRWNLWSELVIGIITAVQAGLLLIMCMSDSIWVCYVTYVLFRGFYQFLVPVATFQIASSLTKELCALVFGINTFFGTVLKSIINLIFSDQRGLALDVRSQFWVFFSYFTLLTVVYLLCAAVVLIRHRRGASQQAAANQQPGAL